MQDDPYVTLAFEVVRLAILDARRGNMGAREWLQSEDAIIYLETFGLNPAWVTAWVRGLGMQNRRVTKRKNSRASPQEGLQGGFVAKDVN